MYYCFKIINNYLTCLDSNLYFSNDTPNILQIRNYDDKLLRVSQFVNNRTDNLFFNRCVHIWNSLTYEFFKLYLDDHDLSKLFKRGMYKMLFYYMPSCSTTIHSFTFLCLICMLYLVN